MSKRQSNILRPDAFENLIRLTNANNSRQSYRNQPVGDCQGNSEYSGGNVAQNGASKQQLPQADVTQKQSGSQCSLCERAVVAGERWAHVWQAHAGANPDDPADFLAFKHLAKRLYRVCFVDQTPASHASAALQPSQPAEPLAHQSSVFQSSAVEEGSFGLSLQPSESDVSAAVDDKAASEILNENEENKTTDLKRKKQKRKQDDRLEESADSTLGNPDKVKEKTKKRAVSTDKVKKRTSVSSAKPPASTPDRSAAKRRKKNRPALAEQSLNEEIQPDEVSSVSKSTKQAAETEKQEVDAEPKKTEDRHCCRLCGKQTKKNNRQHIWVCHMPLKQVQCGRCPQQRHSLSQLKKHALSHHPQQKLKYFDRKDECREQYAQLYSQCFGEKRRRTSAGSKSKAEMNKGKEELPEITEETTSAAPIPDENGKADDDTASDGELQCRVCSNIVGRRTSRWWHVWSSHMPEKRFRCKLCDFQANTSARMQEHGRKAHSNELFSCVDNKEKHGGTYNRRFKRCFGVANEREVPVTETEAENHTGSDVAAMEESEELTETESQAAKDASTIELEEELAMASQGDDSSSPAQPTCRLCPNATVSNRDRHVWTKHMKHRSHYCAYCKYECCRNGQMRRHTRKDHGSKAVKFLKQPEAVQKKFKRVFAKCFDASPVKSSPPRAQRPVEDPAMEKLLPQLGDGKHTAGTICHKCNESVHPKASISHIYAHIYRGGDGMARYACAFDGCDKEIFMKPSLANHIATHFASDKQKRKARKTFCIDRTAELSVQYDQMKEACFPSSTGAEKHVEVDQEEMDLSESDATATDCQLGRSSLEIGVPVAQFKEVVAECTAEQAQSCQPSGSDDTGSPALQDEQANPADIAVELCRRAEEADIDAKTAVMDGTNEKTQSATEKNNLPERSSLETGDAVVQCEEDITNLKAEEQQNHPLNGSDIDKGSANLQVDRPSTADIAVDPWQPKEVDIDANAAVVDATNEKHEQPLSETEDSSGRLEADVSSVLGALVDLVSTINS